MKRMLVIAALGAAFFGTVPVNATADPESRALFAAQATWYWGVDTSGIAISFERGGRCREADVLGWSYIPSDHVHLCAGRWQRLSLAQRCHTWIHEVGHALGHGHTVRGVMAAWMGRPIPSCRWWAKRGPGAALAS